MTRKLRITKISKQRGTAGNATIVPASNGGAGKISIKQQTKPRQTIVIDSEKNDDWMKSLPGYKDEVKIHEELAKKHAARLAKGKPDATPED